MVHWRARITDGADKGAKRAHAIAMGPTPWRPDTTLASDGYFPWGVTNLANSGALSFAVRRGARGPRHALGAHGVSRCSSEPDVGRAHRAPRQTHWRHQADRGVLLLALGAREALATKPYAGSKNTP
eukprot:1232758-Pyramimonas_sp.AAC.1